MQSDQLMDPEEEAATLKEQIAEARQNVCDANICEAAAEIESVKLTIKVKKTLRGHLTKVQQYSGNMH